VKYPIKAGLKPGMRPDPIVMLAHTPPLGLPVPSDADLAVVFPTGKHSLKTWGRAPGVLNGTEPHWIGVHGAQPLHTDAAYPRYTHQLLLRCDDFTLRGFAKRDYAVQRGDYVVVDTHSPHQLYSRSKGARWYVGVSMDYGTPLNPDFALKVLIHYALTAPFLTPEITRPNNGGRW